MEDHGRGVYGQIAYLTRVSGGGAFEKLRPRGSGTARLVGLPPVRLGRLVGLLSPHRGLLGCEGSAPSKRSLHALSTDSPVAHIMAGTQCTRRSEKSAHAIQ